jgi:hypothetical protein
VVVTDTSVINAYLSMVLDIPRDLFFQPGPASISCVRIKGDAYAVRYLNARRPLFEAPMFAPAGALTGRGPLVPIR